MILLSIAIVVVALVAFVAWDIWRSKRKRKAPRADHWIGPIGFSENDWETLPIGAILQAMGDVEEFMERRLDQVVIVLRNAPIPLQGGGTAAGIYHSTKKGWDNAWIELYSLDALEHELLHHATGLEDTAEFRGLFTKYKESREP